MRRGAIAVAVLAAAALAGCGGSEDEPRETRDSDRPALAPAPADPRAFGRFEECLRDNGFEMPEGPPEGGGPVEPPPEDVRRKCEKHLPQEVPPPGDQPRQVPLP